jgi:iron-sulfur cluster insertion protein
VTLENQSVANAGDRSSSTPVHAAPAVVVQLSDAAANRIRALRLKDANPHLNLRLSVAGGGCSGFQYQFDLESFDADAVPPSDSEDLVFRNSDVALVIDQTSLSLLTGSVVDYQETMMHAGFVVTNPNAASSCGCGSSFAI